ncbi:MAG TPA: hypothetical protein VFJ86_04005 [Usitatibacter sp.]|jgi:hypothetical protein|nr:hypothetical protein [Usitatibacter sp.]
MELDSARDQESFECFGIPLHVHVEADGSFEPQPPGWNRRKWLLPDGASLGLEALPSPPLAADIEIEVVR